MTRFLTAAVGIPIVVGVALWGTDWMFALLVAGVAAVGFDEFLALSRAQAGRWLALVAMAVTLSFALGFEWALTILALSLLFVMTVAMGGGISEARERMVTGASGLVYAAALPGFLLLIPGEPVVVLLGIVWAGDIGAYYGGRLLGRRKLAPTISPKKTVEGSVIGLVAAVVAGASVMTLLGMPASPMSAVFFAIVAVAAQIGDLAESCLKRSAGVKDSSSLLPGHGGMLDRVDGLLFAAPVFYSLWSL